MNKRPPDKLPDPWLFDSESLLRELDRCRELVLEIPITNPNATHFGINVAVTAIWNLRDNLRHLLQLHRQGQSAWVKTHHEELQRSLEETPIQGAAGMEKRRKVREFQNRIVNRARPCVRDHQHPSVFSRGFQSDLHIKTKN